MSKKLVLGLVFLAMFLSLLTAVFWVWKTKDNRFLSPAAPGDFEIEKPLEKYSFANLSERQYQGSEIKLEKVLKEEEKFTSWLFSYQSDGKRVTGMANLPKDSIHDDAIQDRNLKPILDRRDAFPVIVMLRGYVDDQIYFTGLGTRKAAGFFAENGFITMSPDFLGFGGSDTCSEDILESRFGKPATVLNLLASIEKLQEIRNQCHAEFSSASKILKQDPETSSGLKVQDDSKCANPLVQKVNPDQIFLWGHSNGGQIALSVLEITGKNIPTSLWAPVTKGFPESVLGYIHEMDDMGKKVTDRIFEFEKLYDPKEFSIDTYFDRINAPLQVQQGGGDYLVEQEGTDKFVAKMKSLGKEISYFVYPNADHNLQPAWDTAVACDLEFFRKFLE